MRMRTKPWARPELAACEYFISEPKQFYGRWNAQFAAAQPIHLEVGCGKGVFLAEMAACCPGVNYIGVDLSSDILGVARRNIQKRFGDRAVENVILTRFNVEQCGSVFSREDMIERLYICFCNPWPRNKHKKRRLTHPRQLENYKRFLTPGAQVHFKTDDPSLFADSKRYFKECGFQIVYQTKDLHSSDYPHNILTEHEIMFSAQGIPIQFLIAKL